MNLLRFPITCCCFATLILAIPATTQAAGVDATTVRDATGRLITVNDTSRIVSVGGDVTEILYALGLEKRVIAVDTTSVYPKRALAEKPNVGYMRQLSAEGVLGLAPSLLLAAKDAGPKETIAVLDAASVPFVHIPDQYSGEGIVEKIHVISQATNATERGACLIRAVESDLAALAHWRTKIDRPVRVLFVLSLMNGRPMVAGRATAADGILKLAGAVNAMTDHEGYKLVNDEAVIAARPDAILVITRDSHRMDAGTVFAQPAFAPTPAAARKVFVAMEGLYLLGFGPRTARAARDLAASLYPSLGSGTPFDSDATAAERCGQ